MVRNFRFIVEGNSRKCFSFDTLLQKIASLDVFQTQYSGTQQVSHFAVICFMRSVESSALSETYSKYLGRLTALYGLGNRRRLPSYSTKAGIFVGVGLFVTRVIVCARCLDGYLCIRWSKRTISFRSFPPHSHIQTLDQSCTTHNPHHLVCCCLFFRLKT